MSSRNHVASSVASTWKFFYVPSALIALMPAVIEPWRNAAVLENTSARKRADGSSGASTVIAIVRVADAALAVGDRQLRGRRAGCRRRCAALAPVASIEPSLSKSHRYVSGSPSASVAAEVKFTGSGAIAERSAIASAAVITGSVLAPVPGTQFGIRRHVRALEREPVERRRHRRGGRVREREEPDLRVRGHRRRGLADVGPRRSRRSSMRRRGWCRCRRSAGRSPAGTSAARLAVWSACALRAVALTSWMNSKNSVLAAVGGVGCRAVELDVVVVGAVDDDPGLLVLDQALVVDLGHDRERAGRGRCAARCSWPCWRSGRGRRPGSGSTRGRWPPSAPGRAAARSSPGPGRRR